MKKAKLMLVAIGCLAVVGGAFAFKASKVQKVFYKTTTKAAGLSFCTVPTTILSSTLPSPVDVIGNIQTTYASVSFPTLTECPTLRLYSNL